MPSLFPRISAVVEPALYSALEHLAKKEGVSMSQKARDLLKEALELEEDLVLESIVGRRRKHKTRFISHRDFWAKRKK